MVRSQVLASSEFKPGNRNTHGVCHLQAETLRPGVWCTPFSCWVVPQVLVKMEWPLAYISL